MKVQSWVNQEVKEARQINREVVRLKKANDNRLVGKIQRLKNDISLRMYNARDFNQ